MSLFMYSIMHSIALTDMGSGVPNWVGEHYKLKSKPGLVGVLAQSTNLYSSPGLTAQLT